MNGGRDALRRVPDDSGPLASDSGCSRCDHYGRPTAPLALLAGRDSRCLQEDARPIPLIRLRCRSKLAKGRQNRVAREARRKNPSLAGNPKFPARDYLCGTDDSCNFSDRFTTARQEDALPCHRALNRGNRTAP